MRNQLRLSAKTGPLDALPTAQEVKLVFGWINIGDFQVAHRDNWGNERFPWRVLGPPDKDGFREEIESFAQYREAVAFSKAQQQPAIAEETRQYEQ